MKTTHRTFKEINDDLPLEWRWDDVKMEWRSMIHKEWAPSPATLEDLTEDPTITETTSIPDAETDMVNSPPHYKAHASGVECIQITEHMGFNLGNAVKYIWRADEKGKTIEDLEKARWYIVREIALRLAKNEPPVEASPLED